MVLLLNKLKTESASAGKMGFSKNPIMRDPKNAPMAAPKMIDNRLVETMVSVVLFRKNT